MKLFQNSKGFIFAFGFDPNTRKPAPSRIAWCDPKTLEWETASSNQAGCYEVGFQVAPQFIFEIADDLVLAYQPGICIELRFIGFPYVWSMKLLRAGPSSVAIAA